MRKLHLKDLDYLAFGAGILGSGGGGQVDYQVLMAREQLRLNGPVDVISKDELPDDSFVLPLAFVGAPLAGSEKLCSLREFKALLDLVIEKEGKRPSALVSAEIGGANAFTAIIAGSLLGLPVVDGDIIGRAFPEIQMTTANLFGVSASPSFFADALGHAKVVTDQGGESIEEQGRKIAVEMGSTCLAGIYLMSGLQAKQALIPGSLHRAIQIGEAIQEASDPVLKLCEVANGKRLGKGTLVEIQQGISGGFLKGTVQIEGEDETITVHYQNEYLLAEKSGQALACTPDILCIVDAESGQAISSESLSYGLRVELLALQAPDLWTSQEGLNVVGPNVFGYDVDYQELRV